MHRSDAKSGIREAVVAEIERTIRKKQGKEAELPAMVKLLANVGDESSLDLLMELSRNRTASVRTSGVWALAKLFPAVAPSLKKSVRERIVKRLERALQDSSEHVRAEAATSFGNTAERSAIPHLIPMLDDRSTAVKSAAHGALKKIVGADIGNTSDAWLFWWQKERKKTKS
jgi:HEAT repeat protein